MTITSTVSLIGRRKTNFFSSITTTTTSTVRCLVCLTDEMLIWSLLFELESDAWKLRYLGEDGTGRRQNSREFAALHMRGSRNCNLMLFFMKSAAILHKTVLD